MFPLQERKLIRGYQAHIKAGLGGAADYVADKNILCAPFDGRIETYWGKEGGNWSRLIRANGDKIEFAHLQNYIKKSGMVKEGEPIAITGNTGQITTGPHLHIQIFNQGKRLDPEAYLWETFMIEIVNDNGTYFVVGNKGKLGINGEDGLAFWRQLTDKERSGSTAGIPKIGTWEKTYGVDLD